MKLKRSYELFSKFEGTRTKLFLTTYYDFLTCQLKKRKNAVLEI